ncbi:MAG: Hpt domain-containing protein [Verrucomicrobia bacterium]|nr:Hpt domain-containing protein [Verrucomicrobiota bacterium]
MDALKDMDIAALMDATGGNRDIAKDLARLYLDLTGQELARLDQAVTDGDEEKVSAIAHKCAGSSISCGLIKLSTLLKALELSSAQEMPPDILGQIEGIRNEMSAAKTALEAYFDCSFAS